MKLIQNTRNSVLKNSWVVATALIFFVLFISCKKTEIPPPAENEIYLMYKMFSPQQLTVKKGTEVIFTNRDNANHSVTSNGGLFDSGKIKSDKSYSFTFEEKGTYYFYCSYHSSNMQENGVITVE